MRPKDPPIAGWRARTESALRGPLPVSLLLGLLVLFAAIDATWAQPGGPAVVRGPYLQIGSDQTITVRWRTDQPTPSRVRYGAAPGSLDQLVSDPLLSVDHELTLSGLTANTTYFYAIGTDTVDLAGDDADHYFATAPPTGQSRPTRVWILGDSGTANLNAANVRDAYLDYNGIRHTDLWLMLGDNAYPDGTDAEYQSALFDMYPETLRSSVLWPTPGNHDYASVDPFSLSDGYYDIFSLPTAGEAGGLASGSEAYYSFDFGNVHFVVLDSHRTWRGLGGAMMTWLAQDLAATTADWIVAYWHHPPYSKGSHDSDTESRMVEMRENAVPILDDYGVDLTFTGHSHDYERTWLIEGHYGDSSTFVETMKVDAGDGDPNGDGSYVKAAPGPIAHSGIVHTVAGSAGKVTGGTLDHPATLVQWNELGSVILDIDGNRADIVFLDDQGQIRDTYTMVKGTLPPPPTVDFVASPMAGEGPMSVFFFDTSAGQPTTWAWDFDDDGEWDSLQQNDVAQFDQPGLYTVRHGVGNPGGSDQMTRQDWICVTGGVPPILTGMSLEPDRRTLSWDAMIGASGYDVVRGNLSALRASSGQFETVAPQCLSEQTPLAQADDPATPPPGQAYFYVARGLNCALQFGSYDSGGPSQPGSRDAGLGTAPTACACTSGGDPDGDAICDQWDACPNDAANDSDGDLVCGDLDLCPFAHDPAQLDGDGDGIGDACDPCPADPLDDADGDGLCADVDLCPTVFDPAQADQDGDGAGDACDLCPTAFDPGQEDADSDGAGDACDPCPADPLDDADWDGLCADVDNCPAIANPGQQDADLDGVGDPCDLCPTDPLNDVDLDGICGTDDNCQLVPNPGQEDQDADSLGDVCDPCPADPLNDADLDGVCGDVDNCPTLHNPNQRDDDHDGAGDVCDICPKDALDDIDADGFCGNVDNCPFVFNPDQADSDGDLIGDACDSRP